MDFDPIDFVLIALAAILLGVLASYSVRLLRLMKKGLLESTWRFVSIGCVFLFVAQLGFIAGFFTPRIGYLDAIDFGFVFNLAGIMAILLGLRSQHNVWRIDKKKVIGNKENDDWRNRTIEP